MYIQVLYIVTIKYDSTLVPSYVYDNSNSMKAI